MKAINFFVILVLIIGGLPMETYCGDDPWVKFKNELGATDDIVERYAAADIAFPTSKEEYCGLGGNAIAMITAISEHIDELPLAKAYITTADNKEIEVSKLRMGSGDSSFTGDRITKTRFAEGEKDVFVNLSFWFIPVNLLVEDAGKLVIDFKGERKGFTVYTGKGDINKKILGYCMKQLRGEIKVYERINVRMLEDFLIREFVTPNKGKENKIIVNF